MSHDPENTEPLEGDVTKDVKGIVCPACASKAVLYIGEAWDAGYNISGHWRCLVCNHQFLDNDADFKP